MGKKMTVKITEAGKHYMKCSLIDDAKVERPVGVPEPLKLGQLSGAGDLLISEKDTQGYHPLLVVSLFVLFTSLLLRIYYSVTATYNVAR